ncbi:MAG: hypothetical protein LBR79_05445 [Oscillospiraceae bacterium]|nr:hypothetical protein [Oscillospiraceae bacterium]
MTHHRERGIICVSFPPAIGGGKRYYQLIWPTTGNVVLFAFLSLATAGKKTKMLLLAKVFTI